VPTLTNNLFYGNGEGHFDLDVRGRWPDDIGGYLFNIGPDRSAPGKHWFTGQGLLCRVTCKPDAEGRIAVDFRRVATPLDRIRHELPHLFRTSGVLEVSPFGYSNFANTNVQALDGRLFLGYDAGRPVEVDPETLEFLTPVGANGEWLASLPAPLEPLISVAAHPGPAWDENALYFANYQMIPTAPRRDLHVCRWDLSGDVEHWVLEGVSHFDSIHDLKVSRDHIVITDLPFVVEPMGPGPEGRRTVGDETQVWIVAKEDLRTRAPGSAVPYHSLRLPMMGGHMALDYDDSDGRLVLYVSHHPITDLGLAIEAGDCVHGTGDAIDSAYEGMIPIGNQPVGLGRYVIDARTGTLVERRIADGSTETWGAALFSLNSYSDDAREHVRDVYITGVGHDPELISERWWQSYAEHHENVFVPPRHFPGKPIPGGIWRIDLEAMEVADAYAYRDGAFAHPPTFIPREGATSDRDGYLLVTVHQDGDKELQLFDAGSLSKGPIAKATAKGFNPPLLLHSYWMERREGDRSSTYCVDAERDAWETLQAFGANPAAGAGIGRAIFEQS
jgi:carotenoid cleavage dioxygenase-like enzyme